MTNDLYLVFDQQYVNKLLEKYCIQMRDVILDLEELGFTLKDILNVNCCISEIHTMLVNELIDKLRDYEIEEGLLEKIEDDIYSYSEINAYCSSLDCLYIFEMYQEYFQQHHQDDLESIKALFEYYDC
jgi:hypothetical protein